MLHRCFLFLLQTELAVDIELVRELSYSVDISTSSSCHIDAICSDASVGQCDYPELQLFGKNKHA